MEGVQASTAYYDRSWSNKVFVLRAIEKGRETVERDRDKGEGVVVYV